MAEINPTAQRAGQQSAQQQPQAQAPQGQAPARPQRPVTVRDANRIPGLASGIDSDKIIDKLVAVEERRLEPVQNEKSQTQLQLAAFNIVKEQLDKIQAAAKPLAGNSIWEGKLVESSNDKVVGATATTGAKPGKYTLIVDKLALNHQIASQGFENQDTQVGTGKVKITVGDANPLTLTIDNSNNTLSGLKDAINQATKDVVATIIKTGNREKPYQLVLTSQKTGSPGRLKPEIELKGGTAPLFENSVEEPSPWKGVGETGKPEEAAKLGQGASTAIAQVVGEFTGSKDHTFTLSAVQTGEIGGEHPVQLRWKDDSGRSGLLRLDSLNYAPGTPVEIADGLSVIFSKGQVVVGDSFSFSAHSQRSDLYWWLNPQDRQAGFSQPTAWQRQSTYGTPVVEGPFTGTDGEHFTLTVEGSGQVGSSRNLRLKWKSSSGEDGEVSVGDGYAPGSKLALTEGLTVAVNQGVLTEGQQSSFDVTPQSRSGKWWLDDKERSIPSSIENVSGWSHKKGEEAGQMPPLPPEAGARTSSAKLQVTGKYSGDDARVYTFTASKDGTTGTTKDLLLKWEDDKGHSGSVNIGEGYVEGTPIKFDAGMSLIIGHGLIFKGDSFTVRTRTSTIQPPQDAQIRFGATELGGGLEITNPTNELDKVIDGVKLTLLATDPKPVNITIKGDTKKAGDAVLDFLKTVNDFQSAIGELTKYDPETQEAAPLQANRDVLDMRNQLTSLLVDPVQGLPRDENMVFNVGVKLNEKGTLTVDEDQLRHKIDDNFAAVADLFRDKGESSNSGIAFVGMGDGTQVSAQGYGVKITQVPTQGAYVSPELPGSFAIDASNNRLVVAVDGKQSGQIVLDPRRYTVAEYARALQNKITNDKAVGDSGVRVIAEGQHIRVLSGRFGRGSTIAFAPSGGAEAGVGLTDGEAVPGLDVQGTIDSQPADGIGQLLKAKDSDNRVAGLRLLVSLTERQLNANGPDATIKITRGVASRTSTYLNHEVDPLTGEVKRITDGLRSQIKNFNTQLDQMQQRIENKRKELQAKFGRMEDQMAKLKSQESYMAGQLGQMGGGGGLVSKLLG